MASQISSRQWVLKHLPEGEIKPFEDFQLKTVSISRDEVKDGKVLLKLLYFSNDPGM